MKKEMKTYLLDSLGGVAYYALAGIMVWTFLEVSSSLPSVEMGLIILVFALVFFMMGNNEINYAALKKHIYRIRVV